MCAFTAGIVNAHTLHVGNKTFALSQTKYTTPSLAFEVGNEVWYAPLTTEVITNTLHIKQKNIIYRVDQPDRYAELITQNCPEIFTDTENYTYDENGRLIGTDERLWIQGNGGYIDTEFVANSNTRIKTKIYKPENLQSYFFGSRATGGSRAFGFLCTAFYFIRDDYNHKPNDNHGTNIDCRNAGLYFIDKNKNVTTLSVPNSNNPHTITNSKTTFTTPCSMKIAATNLDDNCSNPTFNGSTNNHALSIYKYYNFQIWDNDVLVRDMVPVPACMRIGDFIVPENGMWDIVEQKFYGNANSTGTIIYGRDE